MIKLKFGVLLGFLVALFVFPSASFAKEYYFDNIKVDFLVNYDSTVDVAETLRYVFNGSYSEGYGEIPLKKISKITDIQVFDEQGNPVNFWVKKRNGEIEIVWPLVKLKKFTDPENPNIWARQYTIKYKAHGALSFLPNKDELYWNVFENYPVPIKSTHINFLIPTETELEYYIYSQPKVNFDTYTYLDNAATILNAYTHEVLPPNSAVTVAISWPKGFINRASFWKEWAKTNALFIVSGLIVLLAILYSAWYWYRYEYKPHQGVIVPRYNPPLDLSPAELLTILKEKVDLEKIIPATLVEMAVSGKVKKIEEFKPGLFGGFRRLKTRRKFAHLVDIFLSGIIIATLLAFVVFIVVPFFVRHLNYGNHNEVFMGLVTILIVLWVVWARAQRMFIIRGKEYIIYFEPDISKFSEVEKMIYNHLMKYGREKPNVFSTLKMKVKLRDPSLFRTFNSSYNKIETKLIKLFSEKFKQYYEIPLNKRNFKLKNTSSVWYVSKFMQKYPAVFWPLVLIVFVWVYDPYYSAHSFILPLSAVIVAILIIHAVQIDTKLNRSGNKLYQDILGFKLYLKTAEKHRLQNLKPEYFEKFLPYAMVFGLEKKWAKAFEKLGIKLSEPRWYSGAHGGFLAGSSGNTFSSTSFANSFSASFISSISSTSGASGGGGFAGGGAGGGGGGAR